MPARLGNANLRRRPVALQPGRGTHDHHQSRTASMNKFLLRAPRRARILISLVAATSIALGTAVPVSAAVIATFSPQSQTLSVFGDALDNQLAVSRNAAGVILVNGGAVVVQGGTATVANTAL